MLMYSFRLNRRVKRSLMLVAALVAVMAAGRAVMAFMPQGAAEAAAIKGREGKTEQQRQQFIADLGWQVGLQPIETVEVVIPKKFDEVYKRYNELQKLQGMDLSKKRGKRCTKYSYEVLNHPNAAENVRLNLLVCGGKIVGGDVCSLAMDGFMHSLLFPNENLTAKAG